jgi:hypothetical protein
MTLPKKCGVGKNVEGQFNDVLPELIDKEFFITQRFLLLAFLLRKWASCPLVLDGELETFILILFTSPIYEADETISKVTYNCSMM